MTVFTHLFCSVYFQVLNLFLALLLNAFDNGDDDEEEDNENNEDDEDKEPIFKQLLSRLTQTKKTAVFPVSNSSYREEICSSSQELQTILKENESSRKPGKLSAGACEFLGVACPLQENGACQLLPVCTVTPSKNKLENIQ